MRAWFGGAMLGLCAAAIGCGGGAQLAADGGGHDGPLSGFTQTVSTTGDVDVLFMIDDSPSMQGFTATMAQGFSVFTQALEQPPGLPNIQIAVISSDLGAGMFTNVPFCPVGGDGGMFLDQIGVGTSLPGGTFCSSTGLMAGQHFISNIGGVANYDTTMGLDAVFACIASLGSGGCGFGHQLASVARALNADGQGLPPGNEGFLRPDALLAIVLFTNVDDCSAPPDTNLYDPASMRVSDPLGPLQSFRCAEYGHLCNGAPPPRTMAASFSPGACVPADASGKLVPVATYVDQIKSLKGDPSRILVAAIAGPTDPYGVLILDAPPGTVDAANGVQWPTLGLSCTNAATNVFGQPSLRIKAFVDAFGTNGLFFPVCAPSFAPAFQQVASAIRGAMNSCLSAVPDGVDPTAPQVPPGCSATVAGGGGIPACGSGASPCFSFVSNPACPGTGLALSVAPPSGASVTIHCPPAGS